MSSWAGRTVLVANPGADLYGSDRMALETVRALAAAGCRVVVTLPGPGPLAELLRTAGAEVVPTPTPIIRKSALRPAGMLRLIAEVIKGVRPGWALLRAVRPDVVVVNTITAPLWFALCRLRRVPVVGHVHEGEASVPLLVRRVLTLPLRLADRLIVNSQFSLGVLTGAAPALARRSRLVYNSVPGPDQVTPARTKLSAPVRLLYVGRLSARKGPDVAVEAVSHLVAAGHDVRLDLLGAVFSGYEWFEEKLRQRVVELGLVDRVGFLGFCPDRWPATAGADVVLVPSTVDEPFGNVAVEAALAARPLVVSAMTGLIEAAEGIEACVRVEPGRPDQIADAVLTIAADWDRYRELARFDARQMAERYSHCRYAEEILAVLGEVID